MNKKRVGTLLLLYAALMAGVIIFYVLAQYGIGLPCVLYEITGLQCPGCGNSRAALALLRLDFPAAFRYNLLFPLEFGYLLWAGICSSIAYLRTGRFCYPSKYIWIDAVILGIVVIWGIVRNFL